MVVTRRQSAGPMPVASRTNSSTGTSRLSKGKEVDKGSPLKGSGAGPNHIPPNGLASKSSPVGPQALYDIKFDDDSPPAPPRSTPPKATSPKSKSKTKSKKSSKAKKRHPNKGISIFDMLARLFLVWFTVYTISVCPDDIQLRSPVCRALTEYRRVFLEPYVYPPIRAALDHPSIAPHIQRAQPYYNRAVKASTPLVRRGKYEWRTKVAPRIQWFQLRARPYIRQVQRQYDATMKPYVQQVSDVVLRYRVKAEPYVLSAAYGTHRGWITAKPYLTPLWHGVQRVPDLVVVYVGRPLGDARRQWVDPQVAKIWDAVVEQGKVNASEVKAGSGSVVPGSMGTADSTTATPSTPTSSIPQQSESSTSLTSTIPLNDIPEPSSDKASISPPPAPEPTDDAAASASSIIAESASLSTSSAKSKASTDPTDKISEPSSGFTSIPEPPIPKPTDEAAVSASSVIRETLSSSTSATPSEVPIRSSPAPESITPVDDEDLEDLEGFLSDLGLDELEVSESPPPPPPPPVREESEEERAERLRLKAIETAEKRADIEGRHDQWEIDLEKFGKSQRKVVRATLKRLRDAAAEEARTPGAAVRTHVESLINEAEKSIKSLKAYSRKLAGEDKAEYEKVKMWENVVSKVDKKFGEHVDAAADAVRGWWSAHIEKENMEIGRIAGEVRELADRAQADIGMDYSWLADVTYEDWQRYHRLIDNSKEFEDIYLAMQNGTASNAPANPVSEIIEALQEEVDDIILGFEANLGRVKSAAIDGFSGIDTSTDAAAPKSAVESEPEVSILPIDPNLPNEKIGEIPPVILSRGAEEVEAAARRAEARANAVHEEL